MDLIRDIGRRSLSNISPERQLQLDYVESKTSQSIGYIENLGEECLEKILSDLYKEFSPTFDLGKSRIERRDTGGNTFFVDVEARKSEAAIKYVEEREEKFNGEIVQIDSIVVGNQYTTLNISQHLSFAKLEIFAPLKPSPDFEKMTSFDRLNNLSARLNNCRFSKYACIFTNEPINTYLGFFVFIHEFGHLIYKQIMGEHFVRKLDKAIIAITDSEESGEPLATEYKMVILKNERLAMTYALQICSAIFETFSITKKHFQVLAHCCLSTYCRFLRNNIPIDNYIEDWCFGNFEILR